MRRITLSLLAFVLLATSAAAQVPGPRVSIAFNPPANAADCNGASTDPLGWTYQSCYLPSGITVGTQFLASARVIFTSSTGAVLKTVNVSRAQVIRETTTARCPGGTAPCMRIDDISAPAGPSSITVTWVSAEGVAGSASAAVPFTGAPPAPPAPSTVRVVPE